MEDLSLASPEQHLSRRRFLRLGTSLGLAVAGAGLLQACSPGQSTPSAADSAAKQTTAGTRSLAKVRYVTARGGLGDWGSYVGLDKKFFEAEGVDLEQSLLNSFTDAATAIVSGQADLGVESVPAVVATIKQGGPNKLLMATQLATQKGKYNNWWCSLPGAPVSKPEDLKGRKVAILATGSIAQLVTRTVLRMHGLTPGQYEELGFGFDQAYTALKSNRVDVALFIEPFFTNSNKLSQEEYGGKDLQVVYTMLDAFPEGMHLSALGVNTDWLAQNQEVAQRFVRAQLRAAKWGQENPDEAKQIIAKYAQVPYDNIKDMILAELSEDGTFIPGFLRKMQEYMIAEKTVEGLTEPYPDDQLVATGVLPSTS